MSQSTFAPFSEKDLLGQIQEADPSQASRPPMYFPKRHLPSHSQQRAESNLSYLQRRLSRSSPEVKRHVEINSVVMHGNPVFSGSRIPLYQVIEELSEVANIDRLREGYPSLSNEQILAGLDFISSLLRIYDDQAIDR